MTESHSGKPELTDMECDGISSLPGASEASTECNNTATTSSKDADGTSLKLINETEGSLKPSECTDEVFNLENTNEALLLSNESKETFEVTDGSERVKLPNMSKGSDDASKSNGVSTEELMSNKGSDEASFKSNDGNTEKPLMSKEGTDEASFKSNDVSTEGDRRCRTKVVSPEKEFSPDEFDNESRKRKLSGKYLEETSRKRTCEDMPSVSVDEERLDGKESA